MGRERPQAQASEANGGEPARTCCNLQPRFAGSGYGGSQAPGSEAGGVHVSQGALPALRSDLQEHGLVAMQRKLHGPHQQSLWAADRHGMHHITVAIGTHLMTTTGTLGRR